MFQKNKTIISKSMVKQKMPHESHVDKNSSRHEFKDKNENLGHERLIINKLEDDQISDTLGDKLVEIYGGRSQTADSTPVLRSSERDRDTPRHGRHDDRARTLTSSETVNKPHHTLTPADPQGFLTVEAEDRIIEDLKQQKHLLLTEALELEQPGRRKKEQTEIKQDILDVILNVTNKQLKTVPVLTVKGTILSDINKEVQIILDSGCNVNLVKMELVQGRKLRAINKLKLVAANNEPVRILGEIDLKIKIGGLVITDKFLVTPMLTNDIIVGNLFLFKNNMQLNYKDSEIRMVKENKTYVIPMTEGWKELISNYTSSSVVQANVIEEIRTEEDIIIAPHQHRLVINIPDKGHEILFESDKNFRKTKKCHAYIHEITDENKKKISQISIYNASDVTKRIAAGTLIGITVIPELDGIEGKTPMTKTADPITNKHGKMKVTDKDGIPFDISEHLTTDQHNILARLLEDHKHMFTTKTEDLKPIKVPPVKLELKDKAKPTNCIPYKQGTAERQILNTKLLELKRAGVLEDCPDMTENSSPVFLAKNKDNSYRIISDLRKVNQIIKTDVTPIPNINLVLASLNKANTFTRLDLKSAYHQIPVAEESRYLLTIKSQDHMLRFTSIPFGLACASSIFTKIIQSVLQEILYKSCLNYIDDIICYSNDFEGDLESIKNVLKKLDKVGFKLNTTKCKFMYPSTNVLGHKISKKGILPMPETVAAVKNFKPPKTIRQVRSWLGITGFFRKFICNYSQISFPITELIKIHNERGKFTWTQECQEAFDKIKKILTTPPLLRHWNDQQDNILLVDASLIGIGACLAQTDPKTGKMHPIYYMSKRFTPTQMKYSATEREMVALVYSMHYFREYTISRKTQVITDCQALVYFRQFKNTTARLNRLALSLVDYDMEVIHKKGAQNTLADALSRNPLSEFLEETMIDPCALTEINNIQTLDMEKLQDEDEYLKKIKLALTNPEEVEGKIRRRSRNYILQDGILYYNHFDGKKTQRLLAIPSSQVNEILKLFHESSSIGAHFSAFKTLRKIKTRYHFPDMAKLTENYCKTCESCQLRKPKTYKNFGLLQPKLPSTVPGQYLTLDFIGPLQQSLGYNYILAVTDSATRYCFTKLCRNADAKTVAAKLLEICYTVSFPLCITHDRGTHFQNALMKEFTAALGIGQHPAPAYMAQCQGIVERFNQVLVQAISHYVTEKPNTWAKYVAPATFCYNTSVNVSTGYMPYYLMYGITPTFPSEYIYTSDKIDHNALESIKILNHVRKEIPKILEKAQQKQKYYFDRNKQHLELSIGDEVLIERVIDRTKPYHKWANKFEGPYSVLRKINDVTYEILKYHRGKLVPDAVHVSRLKLFNKRLSENSVTPV